MKDPNIGKLIVPIVPDEGQTFGLPPLYNQFGLYSPGRPAVRPGR